MSERHGDKYFACTKCTVRFPSSEILNAHLSDAHGQKVDMARTVGEFAIPDAVDFEQNIAVNIVSLAEPKVNPKIVVTEPVRTKLQRSGTSSGNTTGDTPQNEPMLSRLGITQNRSPGGKKQTSKSRKSGDLKSPLNSDKKQSNKSKTFTQEPQEFVINKNINSKNELFDSRFDKDFYQNVTSNVCENLARYLDGKMNNIPGMSKTEEPDLDSSTLPLLRDENKVRIHESNTNLSSISSFPTLLTSEQYGAGPFSNLKLPRKKATKNSWKWKFDFVKKYKYYNENGKMVKKIKPSCQGTRDLSKLDMWTQLTMKSKYDTERIKAGESNTEEEIIENNIRNEKVRLLNELNSILDTRLFPKLHLEQEFEEVKPDVRALEKTENETKVRRKSSRINDICANLAKANTKSDVEVVIKTEDVETVIVEPVDNKIDISAIPITPTNPLEPSSESLLISEYLQLEAKNRSSEVQTMVNSLEVFLSGEWARPRCYVCVGCGKKLNTLKELEDHKTSEHAYIYSTYYEIVGKDMINSEVYRLFHLPGSQNTGKLLIDEKLNIEQVKPDVKSHSSYTKCTKCKTDLKGEDFYRHLLECAGDAWLLSKKKSRYRPFGTRRRRARLNGCKPSRRQNNGNGNSSGAIVKKLRRKVKKKSGPRVKPSDAETIQRMLANLPAKRLTKHVMPLPKPVQRPLNKNQKHKPQKSNPRHSILVSNNMRSSRSRPFLIGSGHKHTWTELQRLKNAKQQHANRNRIVKNDTGTSSTARTSGKGVKKVVKKDGDGESVKRETEDKSVESKVLSDKDGKKIVLKSKVVKSKPSTVESAEGVLLSDVTVESDVSSKKKKQVSKKGAKIVQKPETTTVDEDKTDTPIDIVNTDESSKDSKSPTEVLTAKPKQVKKIVKTSKDIKNKKVKPKKLPIPKFIVEDLSTPASLAEKLDVTTSTIAADVDDDKTTKTTEISLLTSVVSAEPLVLPDGDDSDSKSDDVPLAKIISKPLSKPKRKPAVKLVKPKAPVIKKPANKKKSKTSDAEQMPELKIVSPISSGKSTETCPVLSPVVVKSKKAPRPLAPSRLKLNFAPLILDVPEINGESPVTITGPIKDLSTIGDCAVSAEVKSQQLLVPESVDEVQDVPMDEVKASIIDELVGNETVDTSTKEVPQVSIPEEISPILKPDQKQIEETTHATISETPQLSAAATPNKISPTGIPNTPSKTPKRRSKKLTDCIAMLTNKLHSKLSESCAGSFNIFNSSQASICSTPEEKTTPEKIPILEQKSTPENISIPEEKATLEKISIPVFSTSTPEQKLVSEKIPIPVCSTSTPEKISIPVCSTSAPEKISIPEEKSTPEKVPTPVCSTSTPKQKSTPPILDFSTKLYETNTETTNLQPLEDSATKSRVVTDLKVPLVGLLCNKEKSDLPPNPVVPEEILCNKDILVFPPNPVVSEEILSNREVSILPPKPVVSDKLLSNKDILVFLPNPVVSDEILSKKEISVLPSNPIVPNEILGKKEISMFPPKPVVPEEILSNKKISVLPPKPVVPDEILCNREISVLPPKPVVPDEILGNREISVLPPKPVVPDEILSNREITILPPKPVVPIELENLWKVSVTIINESENLPKVSAPENNLSTVSMFKINPEEAIKPKINEAVKSNFSDNKILKNDVVAPSNDIVTPSNDINPLNLSSTKRDVRLDLNTFLNDTNFTKPHFRSDSLSSDIDKALDDSVGDKLGSDIDISEVLKESEHLNEFLLCDDVKKNSLDINSGKPKTPEKFILKIPEFEVSPIRKREKRKPYVSKSPKIKFRMKKTLGKNKKGRKNLSDVLSSMPFDDGSNDSNVQNDFFKSFDDDDKVALEDDFAPASLDKSHNAQLEHIEPENSKVDAPEPLIRDNLSPSPIFNNDTSISKPDHSITKDDIFTTSPIENELPVLRSPKITISFKKESSRKIISKCLSEIFVESSNDDQPESTKIEPEVVKDCGKSHFEEETMSASDVNIFEKVCKQKEDDNQNSEKKEAGLDEVLPLPVEKTVLETDKVSVDDMVNGLLEANEQPSADTNSETNVQSDLGVDEPSLLLEDKSSEISQVNKAVSNILDKAKPKTKQSKTRKTKRQNAKTKKSKQPKKQVVERKMSPRICKSKTNEFQDIVTNIDEPSLTLLDAEIKSNIVDDELPEIQPVSLNDNLFIIENKTTSPEFALPETEDKIQICDSFDEQKCTDEQISLMEDSEIFTESLLSKIGDETVETNENILDNTTTSHVPDNSGDTIETDSDEDVSLAVIAKTLQQKPETNEPLKPEEPLDDDKTSIACSQDQNNTSNDFILKYDIIKSKKKRRYKKSILYNSKKSEATSQNGEKYTSKSCGC
ncbi:titin-like [Ctenocephalides felis]|uniref:titin-like n=1 Tax=Ctenocephalides felis TaxID=7515 RepID=UPI000E6E3C2F|nr:titin-like [Ctenocephalides felis]